MVSCAACSCSKTPKTTSQGITFHRFPQDEKKLNAWLKIITKKDWKPTKNSVLCSQHFSLESFDRSSNLKVRLQSSAIPTIVVERLKYVRHFTEVISKPMQKVQEEPTVVASTSGPELSSDRNIAEPSTAETPRKKFMMKRIVNLEALNKLKSGQIKKLQKRAWRQKRKIDSLRMMTTELRQKNLMLSEHENLLVDTFGENKGLITRLFKKTTNVSVRKKYEKSVRAFAITLHFFSPKAYTYVRQKFQNCLPHPKTLCKWYSSINAQPGFTTESFDFLKIKVQNSDKQLICSLVFDEVAIRQHVEYDGIKYHGYVNFGGGADFGDGSQMAKEALVFMLVCVNEGWKLPLGYFFIAGVNSEQKAALTKQCLTLLQQLNIIILSVTFDGCPTNFSMCNTLGCDFSNLKTFFTVNNHKYFAHPDSAHMIKCIRSCFAEKKKFIDSNGKLIDFSYVEALNHLQEQEGLHLGNKLRKRHICFFKQKMKVKLATQLLSKSVADALLYCRDELKLDQFKNCGATAHFIANINDAFDILNSRKLSETGYKQAVCSSNIDNIRLFFDSCHNYIVNLKFVDGTLVTHSNRRAGFVGFLVGLKNGINLYEDHILNRSNLLFLPMYKLSQDHLELFFSTIRSHGGYNNNPTCRQFTAAYKKILIHAEVREDGAGNCVPLEDIKILNVVAYSKRPEAIINESVQQRDNVAEDEQVFVSFLNDHSYALEYNSLSLYATEIIKYIAGFVAFKLGSKIKCENCVQHLFGNEGDFLTSLITKKTRGGLSYPSTSVVLLCVEIEKNFRREHINSNIILKQKVFLRTFNKVDTLKVFCSVNCQGLLNHRFLLIKSICSCYVETRIHFLCRTLSYQESIRTFSNKMVLFKGQ